MEKKKLVSRRAYIYIYLSSRRQRRALIVYQTDGLNEGRGIIPVQRTDGFSWYLVTLALLKRHDLFCNPWDRARYCMNSKIVRAGNTIPISRGTRRTPPPVLQTTRGCFLPTLQRPTSRRFKIIAERECIKHKAYKPAVANHGARDRIAAHEIYIYIYT